MRSSGNGTPEACAFNLLRTVRGEVPYERIKGLDSTLIDRPNPTSDAAADIELTLEIYEPRIDATSIDTEAAAADLGNFGTLVELKRRKEESE